MLGDQYQEYELTKSRINLYCENLADVEIELLRTAATMYMNAVPAKKFFPKIGELREIIQIIDRKDEDELSQAQEAWWYVENEIKRVGSYGLPFFDDEITINIVQEMGWERINTVGELEDHRKEFIEKYKKAVWDKKHDLKVKSAKELIGMNRKLLK